MWKKRILAFLLCLCMVIPSELVTVSAEETVTTPVCDKDCNKETVGEHTDECAVKVYYKNLYNDSSAEKLYQLWESLPSDAQDYILKDISWNDQTKRAELVQLIENGMTDEPCDTCGKMGCTSNHENWCELCQLDDCGKTHVWCEICNAYDCGLNHSGGVPTISATVTDSEGNEQTVTVSGDALPEGARLVVTPVENEAEIMTELEMEGGFIWDIKVYDKDGNEWQPTNGEEVSLTLPVDGVPNGSYVDIDHFPETEDGVSIAMSKKSSLIGCTDEFSLDFADMVSATVFAWQKVTNQISNNFVLDRIQSIQVKDEHITFTVDSFSIYKWENGYVWSRYSNANTSSQMVVCKSNDDSVNGQTFYITNGQSVIFDTGRIGTLKKNWKIEGAGQSFSDTDSDQAWLTVTGASLGATFYVAFNGTFDGAKGTIYFVVVEERTVNFNGNGGTPSVSSAMAITDGGSHNQYVTLPTATRSGYTFLGWYTAASGGTKVGDAGASYMPASNGVTLYAQWSYDVNYNTNGGSGSFAKQTANANNNVVLHSATPTRPGYTFFGWYSSADGAIYQPGATYSMKKPTTLTAIWGKQDSNGAWNKSFYILSGTTSSSFADALEYIDIDKTTSGIQGDSNIYYVAPGTTVALAHDSGLWRIDGAESGLSLKAGTNTVNSNSWSGAATNATLTVSASAAVDTTMMIYVRDAAEPTEVSCAKVVVQSPEQLTKWAIDDINNDIDIYRVGVYIITDSTNIPGEPKWTSGVDMINIDGMNYKVSGAGVIDEAIATSAHYVSSIDGSCTMGVVDYTGHETKPYIIDIDDDAMQRVITELENSNGKTIIASDGTNLRDYYNENGKDALLENYAIRPHIVKLMTGLSFDSLGWHIDCSIYALDTVTLTYNLNPPEGYVLVGLDTPDPIVGKKDVAAVEMEVFKDIPIDKAYTATVSGSSDTASLIFKGWNTKPDGTGTSYAPGAAISILEDTTLYGQWTGGNFTTGTLEVYKEVTIAENSLEPVGNDTFSFSINLTGSKAYTIFNKNDGSMVSSGTMTNGTFTLKDGQFIRFSGVPTDNYTITENNLPTNYSVTNATQSHCLVGGYTNVVTFTNVYSDIPSYTVTGTIDNGGTSTDIGQSVKRGGCSKEMTFIPAAGYEIQSIMANNQTIAVTDANKNGYTYPAQNNVLENITVTVTTVKQNYTLTFVANYDGAQAPTPASKVITYKESYGDLATVSRTGYSFDGWFTEATGGAKVTEDTTYNLTTDSTLYAHWTPITYQVAFDGNGATSGNMSNQSFTYDVAQALSANAFARQYTVTYNAKEGTVTATDINTTATAVFNGWATTVAGAKSYNDKQSVSNLTAVGGSTFQLYANWTLGSVTLPEPETLVGYTFLGWYEDEAFTTLAGTSGKAGESYTPQADITLYAKWQKNTFTITASVDNGGTIEIEGDKIYSEPDAQNVTHASQTVAYGEKNKKITIRAATGYKISDVTLNDKDPFLQISYSTDKTTAGFSEKVITDNIDIVVKTEPITYDLTWVTEYPDKTVTSTEEVKYGTALTIDNSVPQHYTTTGWYVTSPDSGYDTLPTTMPATDLTITRKLTFKGGSLKITKSGMEEGKSAEFQVVGTEGSAVGIDVTVTVQIKDNDTEGAQGSVILHYLPEGTYTITEKNWSWEYESTLGSQKSQTIVISTDNTESNPATLSFTNQRRSGIGWLSGEYRVNNKFGAKSTTN